MCGIAGICRLDGQPLNEDARAHVRAMTDVITYRGPDGSGIWQEGSVSLGHRRLSIIDLSGGSQPMQDVDGELCIVFNGEIYNFAELRQELLQAGARFHSSHSDTEVILQAYRVWGTDCLQRFDGMFAFALWDAPRRRLFCARDRFGKKPFFYTLQQGSLFFGSELNCLAAVPGLELTLDPQAVMRYLAYEYVPTPDTMYREAKSLPPSHWLLVEDGRLSIRRYWDLPPADEDDRRSEADICADVHELLTRAVGRRMVSDVPLGVFLSGGIDSSIVAGLMARQSSTPIKTFSIGFTEASYDESRYARVVAQRWNTDHHERVLSAEDCAEHLPNIISRMDVPMADASVAPTWLLSGVTREKVTVALGGDGADELWAGYEHYIAFKIAEWYNAIPGILRRGVIEPLTRLLPASAGYINPRLAVETFLRGAHAPAWERVQTLLTPFTPEMQAELLARPDHDFLRRENLFAPTREQFEHWPAPSTSMPASSCWTTSWSRWTAAPCSTRWKCARPSWTRILPNMWPACPSGTSCTASSANTCSRRPSPTCCRPRSCTATSAASRSPWRPGCAGACVRSWKSFSLPSACVPRACSGPRPCAPWWTPTAPARPTCASRSGRCSCSSSGCAPGGCNG